MMRDVRWDQCDRPEDHAQALLGARHQEHRANSRLLPSEDRRAVSVLVVGVAACTAEQHRAPRAAVKRAALKNSIEQLRASVLARKRLAIDRLEPATPLAHVFFKNRSLTKGRKCALSPPGWTGRF